MDIFRSKSTGKKYEIDETYLNDIIRICLAHISPVTSPLALISQIQRSGGSLLSQLFDSHPQVHAHPHELKIGYPKKYFWPKIDLSDSPDRWFFLLFEDVVLSHIRHGFKKIKKGKKVDKIHPFVFVPFLQKKIFLQYVNSITPLHLRDVFDGYMTSYFNAWLNNYNLYGGDKKYVIAFTPRLAMLKESLKDFLTIYPDGKLISVVRDPKNWFPSAIRHRSRNYGDVSKAMDQWKKSAQATITNKEKLAERLCIIRFEDLIASTRQVMQHLSDFLGIEFHATLLSPTFNGNPISADTSFEIEKPKIIESTLYRYKTLSKKELDQIDSLTKDIYETLLKHAIVF